MAVNAGFYVTGAKELRAAMDAAAVDQDLLKDANQRVSEFVAGVARWLSPVGDSGALQGTIRGTRQVGRAVVRAGSAAVPYAGNVHYGWPGSGGKRTRGARGGPFPGAFYIINAAQQSESLWLDTYVSDIQKILDLIGASTP